MLHHLPSGCAHNGGPDECFVLGFADITIERVVAPREDVSNDDQGSYDVSHHHSCYPAEPIVEQRLEEGSSPEALPRRPRLMRVLKPHQLTFCFCLKPRSNASATSSPLALDCRAKSIEGTS